MKEFEHLLSRNDYARIRKEFKHKVRLLLKEVLCQWDSNRHTPLHVSSYFGDFKSSRLFTQLGAEPASEANDAAPLTVAKDKFSRGVLSNLTAAAQTANKADLAYLVNCGEDIDGKASIVGQAPIHKVVLSQTNETDKELTLEAIFKCKAQLDIVDSNGWTALHHAAYAKNDAELRSVELLIAQGAPITAYSNQFKTPLHLACLQNNPKITETLLNTAKSDEDCLKMMLAEDELKCSPLHLACKNGSQDCIELLLKKEAIIINDLRERATGVVD